MVATDSPVLPFRGSTLKRLSGRKLHATVIVAVIAMGMVEMPRHEIVDVTIVWHSLVSATASMDVPFVVPAAGVARRTGRRIHRATFERVLIHVVAVRMVQVAVMQVVSVILVLHRGMAAVGSMCVSMAFVLRTSHRSFLSALPKESIAPTRSIEPQESTVHHRNMAAHESPNSRARLWDSGRLPRSQQHE
jgi:hypothetical protein